MSADIAAHKIEELRNEIARLKGQTNWVCTCGGTDCEGQRQNAELEATLIAVYDANQRGIKAWQQAHPDKAMVWPDQAKLVEWLLRENTKLQAHAERVGGANDRLVVENAALRAELGWKTKRIKLLSDSLHDIEGVLKKAATSIFLDAFEAERKEAKP